MYTRDRMAVEDRSLVHTVEALGKNQSITPEGFLLCRDVPIARTGMQEYLNDEICGEDDTDNELHGARGKNGIVQVDRPEEEVFRPETIASFEGKDVVDDHPDDPVHPGNYKEHTVGVVLNPRRGEGAMSNFMLGDLLIKEEGAIAAVRAGKREVSGGYDADYEVLGPGRARQHNIIGNHVALVDRGRCGFRCAIGDKEPDMKTKANTKDTRTLVQRVMDAVKKNPKALDAALAEMEEDEGNEEAALESTGTHIHLHLGGEEEAKGKDPAIAGEADEDDPEAAEGEEEKPDASAGSNTEKRLMALEAGMHQMAEAMRKLLARVGGGESEEEAEGDEDPDANEGEEEAEGDDPEMDEAEVEKEPKEKDKKKDKMGFTPLKDKKKDKAKDTKTVRDSAHLKDDFTDAKSGAEILAPGLKMPTFDAKAASTTTKDSICLLKRRALAAAMRDEKNGGKDSVETMLGKKPLAGLDCAIVDSVFNGAVALMTDRNTRDDSPKTVSQARGVKSKDQKKAPESVSELNAAMREHYKQPAKQ